MTKALDTHAATAELAALLAADDNGFVANIVAAQAEKALQTEKTGNNAAIRKAAIRKAAITADKKAVADHVSALKSQADLLNKVAARAEAIAESGANEDDAVLLMSLIQGGKLGEEFIKASYDLGKELVFRTLDLAFAEAGEEFPEQTNGFIDVPETGKRFAREMAGRRDSKLDEDKLRELVGEDVWAQITREEVIPATVVRKLDEQSLIAAAAANPALLEQVREAVKVGDWKAPRLMIRDIPANEKE
jgi:hypothetical protein